MTRKKKGRNRKNKENENGDDENKIFKENEGTGILSQAASWHVENLSDAEEENLAQVEGSRAADDIWKERLTEPCRADTTSSYRSSQEKMPVGREVTPAKEATAVHESHHLPFAWCGELIELGQTADVRNSGGLSVLISDIISDGVETEVVGFLLLNDSVDRGLKITTNIERLSVNQKKLNEEGIKLRNSIRQSSYELHLENSKKISKKATVTKSN